MATRPQLLDPRMAAVVIAVVAVGAGVARSRMSDVEVCRRLFQDLAIGSSSVERRIDWERLTALNADIGSIYRGLPNEQERRRYQQAFVANFSKSFQQTGARPEQFVRWRAEGRTPEQVVVAADYPQKNQALLLTVPARGKKRLQAIQWK